MKYRPSFSTVKMNIELLESSLSSNLNKYCRVQEMIYGTCMQCSINNKDNMINYSCRVCNEMNVALGLE